MEHHQLFVGDFLRSIDQFFTQSFQEFHENERSNSFFPIRTFWKDDHFIIEASLAGVSKEQIQLDIYHHHVRIAFWHREEISYENESKQIEIERKQMNQAERIVPLPFNVNSKGGTARFTNGLLTITFPRERKKLQIND